MSGPHPPDVETTPSPAVSSLRSRFEKLATEAAVEAPFKRPPSSLSVHDSSDSSIHHARTASNASDHPPPSQYLRPVSSSSDMKAGIRRPAPPPPSHRAASPSPHPSSSPLIRPVPDSIQPALLPEVNVVDERSLSKPALQRKPPPPPPPLQRRSAEGLSNKFQTSVASPVVPSAMPVVDEPNTGRLSLNSLSPFEPSRGPVTHATRSSFLSPEAIHDTATHPAINGQLINQTLPIIRPPALPTRRNVSPFDDAHLAPHEKQSSSTESYSSSQSTSDNESNSTDPSPVASSSSLSVNSRLPPKPPPRHHASLPQHQPSPQSSVSPPPLPARKATAEQTPSRRPNPSPDAVSTASGLTASLVSPPERKTFGSLPPPPTRTIALGDKLPPPRRPVASGSGSSSESEDEELKLKQDLLPDSSRSSRRPPVFQGHFSTELNIHIPTYAAIVAVSGNIVAVAAHHRLKIYDLTESDIPVHDLDARDIGLEMKSKELRITAMEFRPPEKDFHSARYLWAGTKEGHLLEIDVQSGSLAGMKLVAHAHQITHMFRYKRSMASMDNAGKVLVFTADSGGSVSLAYTQSRVVRIADKQEFVKVLAGQLWTSARESNNGPVGAASRGPVVRIYDIFSPAGIGKSVLPTEHLGTVTSGTMLASQPGVVFLGHEGGHVSIWSVPAGDALPQCEEIIKVSTSDILCLEGVNDRLWAGGRQGMIAAYDIVPRPWIMTNSWRAHEKLPVLSLVVDTYGIERMDRLCVYSIGRDERLRFWDGFLALDWIDQELLRRDKEFSSFRDMNVLIVSWNLDSSKPEALSGTPENVNFLSDALHSVDSPDMIVFGLQELIDLESRKMAAKTVLLGAKNKNADGSISQRVSTAYKKWFDRLVQAVRLAMPADTPYTVIHTESLVGLFSCIFVKNTEKISLKQTAITTIKRGMGGRYGNKGGIVCRFIVDDSSICLINCHLAAGQNHARQRNADIAAILEDKSVFPETIMDHDMVAYVNGGDGSMVLDHELVFINGDMNYRIDLRRDAIIADIKTGNVSHLLSQDQLLKEMANNRGFRLRSFTEGKITFSPTYKYDRFSNEYDTSEKRRAPAWCDRILWRCNDKDRVEQLHYRRYEVNVSDHRPISGGFRIRVKSVRHDARERIKAEVQGLWMGREKELLATARRFYIEHIL
ncbi:unnamed protein product [Somion occarium]|uniref:Inositol polyphosphate-related phosphatase domain-containing protein n=3 Tax=Somion occarium TaxID=3059160 RepID=A0ABP1D455_9APHY